MKSDWVPYTSPHKEPTIIKSPNAAIVQNIKTQPYIVQEHTVGKTKQVTHIYLDTKETYFYIHKNHHRHNMSAQTIKERRLLVLGQLLITIGVADRNLVLYQWVQDYLNNQEQEQQQMIDTTDRNIDHDHHNTDTNT